MKLETLLAKYFDIAIVPHEDFSVVEAGEATAPKVVEGAKQIEIFERESDCEPIGWFIKLDGKASYEWRNIYSRVKSGTYYADEAAVKTAVKAGAFNPG